MIKKTFVKAGGKEYEVQFPSVGQLQDIESMKIALTNGRYADMAIGGLTTHIFALDSADAISYLSVLIPSLKDDLKVKSWRDLDALTAKQLIKDYKKFMSDWLKPLLDDLYNFDEGEKETEEDSEDGDE